MQILVFILSALLLVNSYAMTVGGQKSNHPAVTSIITYSPNNQEVLTQSFSTSLYQVLIEAYLNSSRTQKDFETLKFITQYESDDITKILQRHNSFKDFWQQMSLQAQMEVNICSASFVAKNIIRTAWHCIGHPNFTDNLKNKTGSWQKISGFAVVVNDPLFSQATEFMRPQSNLDIVYLRFKNDVTNDYLPEATKDELLSYFEQASAYKSLDSHISEASLTTFYGYDQITDLAEKEDISLTYQEFLSNDKKLNKITRNIFISQEQKVGVTKFERIHSEHTDFKIGDDLIQGSSNTISQKEQCTLPGDSGGPLVWKGKVIGTSSSIYLDSLNQFFINYPSFRKKGTAFNLKIEEQISEDGLLLSVNGRIFCNFSFYGIEN